MRGSVFLSLLTVGGAAATATTCKDMKDSYEAQECCGLPEQEVPVQIVPQPSLKNNRIVDVAGNPCKDKDIGLKPVQCFVDDIVNAMEQAGGDVTEGFVGQRNASAIPIQSSYFAAGLCPVNVHWHLGAEHRSAGQYDEHGKSPELAGTPLSARSDDGSDRYGFACRFYDASDPKFTTPYNWQHCKDMHVGETYEVHWPHSALGACNSPFQYQTPFPDGLFCRYNGDGSDLDPQTIASSVGVQAQVFTIVNDEEYFYPNLMRGMIVNEKDHGLFGQDLGIYTGSATGTSVGNEICSGYKPITWHVDRTCHLISASSFDKMCADMKHNVADMSNDLHAHGSRQLVSATLNANNLESGNHQHAS